MVSAKRDTISKQNFITAKLQQSYQGYIKIISTGIKISSNPMTRQQEFFIYEEEVVGQRLAQQ
jgi:hypothetical protein